MLSTTTHSAAPAFLHSIVCELKFSSPLVHVNSIELVPTPASTTIKSDGASHDTASTTIKLSNIMVFTLLFP